MHLVQVRRRPPGSSLTSRHVLADSSFTANWAPQKCSTGSVDIRASWLHVACRYPIAFAQVGICTAAAPMKRMLPLLSTYTHIPLCLEDAKAPQPFMSLAICTKACFWQRLAAGSHIHNQLSACDHLQVLCAYTSLWHLLTGRHRRGVCAIHDGQQSQLCACKLNLLNTTHRLLRICPAPGRLPSRPISLSRTGGRERHKRRHGQQFHTSLHDCPL